MLESIFQKKLIEKIKKSFPGSIAIKNDASYIQGFPDWTIFYKDKYALLECKKEKGAHHQPNQEYYISKFTDDGAFACFVYPENEEEVLNALHGFFEA